MATAEDNEDTLLQMTRLLAELTTTTVLPKLRDPCVRFFEHRRIQMMSYHHLPPLGAQDYTPQITVATHGFPTAWVERYVADELYRVDPIPKRALDTTRPFRWSEIRGEGGLTPSEHDYLDLLAASKVGDGLAIPVFGPHGRNGYVGLGFGSVEAEFSSEEIIVLQLASQLGHQTYCQLLFKATGQEASLSAREQEIMNWICRGKSNAVIATILDISHHTVDTHLRRIYGKLGVSDRVTAALRSLALGLI